MTKRYIDLGMNWVFPYSIIYEDECILQLQELPRIHKSEFKFSKDDKVIDIRPDSPYVFVDQTKKLIEIFR